MSTQGTGVPSLVRPSAELLPITFGSAARIQKQVFGRPLLLLLDSGSTSTWINKKSLPKGIMGKTVNKVSGSTLAGSFTSSEQVDLYDFVLPEFHGKRFLPHVAAQVFHAECRYDMIVGRDILRAFGIKLDFEDDCVVSQGISRPMREFPTDLPKDIEFVDTLLQDHVDSLDDDISVNDEGPLPSDTPQGDGFAQEILDSKYDAILGRLQIRVLI